MKDYKESLKEVFPYLLKWPICNNLKKKKKSAPSGSYKHDLNPSYFTCDS